MQKKYVAAAMIVLCVVLISCNKKQQPQTAVSNSTNTVGAGEKKILIRKVPKTAVPKVIIVDDRTAGKTIDGRLYYDLEGHRYWKNYNDGKYYLYNQSMYNDKAFKPH